MSLKYPLALCIFSMVLFSCKHDHTKDHTHGKHEEHAKHGDHEHKHNHANKHMHKKSLEELAESFESPERLKTQRPYEVIALFGNLEGKKIMDIGAGTGYFSFKLAEKGAQVIAADVDDQFQEFIVKKMEELNVDEEQIELRKVPYDDPNLQSKEVDGVIVVNTYHHIDDRKTYFKKVKEGLKDDGMLMIVDFKKQEFDEEVPGPPIEMRISSEVVMNELSIAGFSRVDLNNSMLPYQYVMRAYK